MRRYLLLLYILVFNTAIGQQPLSRSLKSTKFRYLYQVTPAEALKLYNTNLRKVNDSYLHTLVDSFHIKTPVPKLQAGNYLLIHADSDKLQYELVSSGDVQLKLVNNKRDLNVLLHDNQGTIIQAAAVKLNGRPVKFDPSTQSYRLNNRKKSGSLQVTHANTVYYFHLKTNQRPGRSLFSVTEKLITAFPMKYITKTIRRWRFGSDSYNDYFNRQVPYESRYRGFMSFNKPMYKPGDTVRFKAFITNKIGKGVDESLIVRISNQYLDIDTIITTLKPYRPGGYSGEFVLNDSLDLDLDDDYLITIEKQSSRKYDLDTYDGDLADDDYAAKRKILMRGKFSYEEYELESITFKARADSKEHLKGSEFSIFLKGTDENDLPVMDGRLQITVLPSFYSKISFHNSNLFIPDTLWSHNQPLENIGETKITIPDSLFPSASFDYEIHCTLLNSNNERHSQTLHASFHGQQSHITFNIRKDSLAIDLKEKSQSKNLPANIYAYTATGDTLQNIMANLPTSIKVNPYASHYEVVCAGLSKTYHPAHSKGMVSALAIRTKDSLHLQLNNPNHLPVWYTLFAGNKIVGKGYGESLSLNTRTTTRKNYFFSIQYVYANEVYSEDYTIPYKDKLLKLTVNAPLSIYPGQTTEIEIGVSDAEDKPVAGADITAYAFTKKLHSTNSPHIPYMGKIYPERKRGPAFRTAASEEWKHLSKLNWAHWSKEMGLDTIEFYKFLYPDNIYINKEAAKDSITQIAPFVVINGEIQPIHILYIDETPHYFSKSQHLSKYSFRVSPGRHSLRIRTHNRVVWLKEITVPKGFKTIISINADTSNKMITIQKAPDTLTLPEQATMAKYSILVSNVQGEYLNYISQDKNYFLLPNEKYQSYNPGNSLVGPLMPQLADLVVLEKFRQAFEVEGGYFYQITKGLIKQKELKRHPFNSSLSDETPALRFSDLVLTGQEIDSLWNEYLNNRSASEDLFMNPFVNKKGNGALHIDIKPSARNNSLFVRNIFLFRYDDTDFLRVYKGQSRNLGFLAPGTYRLLFLLKDDKYLSRDSIQILSNGLNYYSILSDGIRQADAMSRKLSGLIKERELSNRGSSHGLNEIIESFNSEYLDSSSFTNTAYGRVEDEKGQPIIAASIVVKGTHFGTITDKNGHYKLNVPLNGTLIFECVGYQTRERKISNGLINVVLREINNNLQEVVVTAFASAEKRSLAFMAESSGELQGRAPGLMVRGAASLQSNAKPLILINGVPYEGALDDLDKGLINNLSILNGDIALGLYGAKAANGAILITTKSLNSVPDNGALVGDASNSLRRKFRDYAYWQPTLRTDKDGKVRFNTTFPDDITNWLTYAIAFADKKQTGYSEGLIRSFKSLSINLSLPQFAVEGDRLNFIGKTMNYGSDSVAFGRKIKIDDRLIREGEVNMKNVFIDTVLFEVPQTDSVRFHIELTKMDGYFDGEERTIPVFRQGVIETRGVFAALNGDTSLTLQLDPKLGPITLYAEGSVLPAMLDETEKLYRYEYLCNEQLASKLKALLYQKKICSYLKKEFEKEKAIADIIKRLINNKTGNLWGWWVTNEPVPWISLHVIEALLQAEKDGYKIDIPKAAITDHLVFNMENYRSRDKLISLRLLQQLHARVDYKRYIDTLESTVKKMPLYDRLRFVELKQDAGIEVSVDSLVSLSRQTLFGNIYWGDDGYRFLDNEIQNTILMYRILKQTGANESSLRKIRGYFLEKRKDGQWRNTYESSLILETILPDLMINGEMPAVASLTLSSDPGKLINNFPYKKVVDGTEPITIRKEGGLPVYFTAYQQSWNKVPDLVAGAFTVSTKFIKAGDSVSLLEAGEPVNLLVTVTAKGDADYIMIEIPIPAGCSYKDKPQPQFNNEVHREYFKSKVSIFCSSLKQGTYTFTVPLLPRYTGNFHLNPAKAEMMYFPVFYGREKLKQIVIE
ncbi:MAG: carboxypeptidase-like regulatory domain-containing protein [Gemmatimonadaceae bacterium]|nr:carboxypeptidase-like regulatory domain-containing protein [Chitinophagaceae bacterium]